MEPWYEVEELEEIAPPIHALTYLDECIVALVLAWVSLPALGQTG